MTEEPSRGVNLQDHAAFLAGKHDFQTDIEAITKSDTVGVILETVMLATDMRFVTVARVTDERWVACRTVDEIDFGLVAGDEIDVQTTFCRTVRETSEEILFNDATSDPVYRGHPIATQYGIASYASIPIFRSNGAFFGTLCALDPEPRNVKQPRAVAMLKLFADIIGRSLETEERLMAHEQLAAHEREMTKIQEEFVAVLGHDLRSPVAALSAGIRHLEREPGTDSTRHVVSLMKSSLLRMHDLIENMMLHAKSRLGGGIRIQAVPDAPLGEAIEQVVAEIRAAFPDRAIDLELAFDRPLSCDAPRVAQAVSNLVSNAIRHADPDHPVQVRTLETGGDMVLQVINRGEAIPDHVRNRLFKPFQRGKDTRGEGLGLGLYIASSIAAAHGGRLDVACDDGLTTFAFTLPTDPPA